MPTKTARRSFDDQDPITNALAPPSDETPDQRDTRLRQERRAKDVSDAIDDEIVRFSNAEKKAVKPVRVLLLGQSESGKSTTLKNFQLMSEPKAFRRERASWRAVIQLNIVRSIHVILDALSRSIPNGSSSDDNQPSTSHLDPEVLKLKMRLSPLLRAEEILIRRLTPADSGQTEATQLPNAVPHFERHKQVLTEVAINSTIPWKEMFSKYVSNRESFDSEAAVDWDNPEDPGRVLHECAGDMTRLWQHPNVQVLLEQQNLRLEEMAGFFLDCLDEVTAPRYLPSDDHILRARLKTMGVSEHRIKMLSAGSNMDWRIFDVGGHRSLRTAWAPYFQDVDAIIFLAPISAFDQVLAEAPKVNRLEDSVLLWTSIVSNKLLEKANIILFLNKCDIMKAKLADGIKLKDYVVSYGSRPNDFENASNYLAKKFSGILKENSPVPRVFHCHLTSVIDQTSTKQVIAHVKEMLMRSNLKNATMLV